MVAAEVPDRSQPWPAAFRLFVLLSSHFSDSTHDADDELLRAVDLEGGQRDGGGALLGIQYVS